MTLTILNTGDSVDVDVASMLVPSKADYAIVDTVANGETRECTYQKVVGDSEYPMSVRVGYYKKPTTNEGIGSVNLSIKISTFVQKTEGTDIIWTKPASATLALAMPGGTGVPDIADVKELIGNLFAWALPVQAGIVVDSGLEELEFGVVNGLLAYENTAST